LSNQIFFQSLKASATMKPERISKIDSAVFRGDKPKAHLTVSKSFNEAGLKSMRMGRIAGHAVQQEQPSILSDRIFVRCKRTLVKIMLNDVLFIEANRNYSQLVTKGKDYVVTSALREVEAKLPSSMFLRTHRSFIVNMGHIDEVGERYLGIAKKRIPLGAGMRKRLLANFQTV
jgi:DNA-binding LytR/AlgR family response regulator